MVLYKNIPEQDNLKKKLKSWIIVRCLLENVIFQSKTNVEGKRERTLKTSKVCLILITNECKFYFAKYSKANNITRKNCWTAFN